MSSSPHPMANGQGQQQPVQNGSAPAASASSSSSTSASSGLLGELEQSFAGLMQRLTAEDNARAAASTGGGAAVSASDEEQLEEFIKVARKLETFFLQKRLLIYNHKPEIILREESHEMKKEIVEKEDLIRKHMDKLVQWQTLLQDMQGQQSGPQGAQGGGPQGGPQGAPGVGPQGMQQGGPRPGLGPHPGVPGGPPGGLPLPMHPGAPMAPGAGAPQGGFLPGNNYRMQLNPLPPNAMHGMGSPMMGPHPGMGGGPGGPHPGGMGGGGPGAGGDPLNYLERATANVGTPPMGR